MGNGFTTVFGGSTIAPAIPTLQGLTLTGNIITAWPMEQGSTLPVIAGITEVTALAAGYTITLADATQMTEGFCCLWNNVGAFPFSVLDTNGNILLTVPSGQVWQMYLADNTTPGGTWRVFQYGAGVSSANASSLAGLGLKAITTTLNVRILVQPLTLNYAIMNSDRASCLEWTGGSGGTLVLPAPASVGSDWFCYVKNSGAGTVALSAGASTINGGPSQTFNPNDSAIVICDGTQYFTIGLGQSVASSFNFVTISLAGATGTVALSGAQLNRISYKFTGALAGNVVVQVPASIQQYWVDNETTGAFSLTMSCGAGSTVAVPQGGREILYCDGGNIVNAITTTASTPTFPNGVPGNPSITFTSDLTTGLFLAGADTLGFATLGVQRGQIASNGTWGFNVPDSGTTMAISVINGQNGFALSDGTSILAQTTDAAHNMYWGVATAHGLGLTTSGLPRLTISPVGGVIVQTPASGTALQVNGFAGANTLLVQPGNSASPGITVLDPSGTAININTSTTEASLRSSSILSIYTNTIKRFQMDATGAALFNAPTVLGLPTITAHGSDNNDTLFVQGSATSDASFGLDMNAGTTVNDRALRVASADGTRLFATIDGLGNMQAVDQSNLMQTVGWRDMPGVTLATAAVTPLVAGYRGKMLVQNGTGAINIPSNAALPLPVGTFVAVANRNAASIPLTITTDLLFIMGTPTGGGGVPRTIGPRGYVVMVKIASNEWWVSGSGLS